MARIDTETRRESKLARDIRGLLRENRELTRGMQAMEKDRDELLERLNTHTCQDADEVVSELRRILDAKGEDFEHLSVLADGYRIQRDEAREDLECASLPMGGTVTGRHSCTAVPTSEPRTVEPEAGHGNSGPWGSCQICWDRWLPEAHHAGDTPYEFAFRLVAEYPGCSLYDVDGKPANWPTTAQAFAPGTIPKFQFDEMERQRDTARESLRELGIAVQTETTELRDELSQARTDLEEVIENASSLQTVVEAKDERITNLLAVGEARLQEIGDVRQELGVAMRARDAAYQHSEPQSREEITRLLEDLREANEREREEAAVQKTYLTDAHRDIASLMERLRKESLDAEAYATRTESQLTQVRGERDRAIALLEGARDAAGSGRSAADEIAALREERDGYVTRWKEKRIIDGLRDDRAVARAEVEQLLVQVEEYRAGICKVGRRAETAEERLNQAISHIDDLSGIILGSVVALNPGQNAREIRRKYLSWDIAPQGDHGVQTITLEGFVAGSKVRYAPEGGCVRLDGLHVFRPRGGYTSPRCGGCMKNYTKEVPRKDLREQTTESPPGAASEAGPEIDDEIGLTCACCGRMLPVGEPCTNPDCGDATDASATLNTAGEVAPSSSSEFAMMAENAERLELPGVPRTPPFEVSTAGVPHWCVQNEAENEER